MNPILAQREIALGGVALLSVLVSLAIGAPGGGSKTSTLPQPVGNGSSWYRALAAPGGGTVGRRSACGIVVQKTTLGVAHPVLPCGAKIFIAYGGHEVLTQIIAHAPRTPGLEFEITPALAEQLGLRGVQQIRWTFARA
jgi:hypothetical protein